MAPKLSGRLMRKYASPRELASGGGLAFLDIPGKRSIVTLTPVAPSRVVIFASAYFFLQPKSTPTRHRY